MFAFAVFGIAILVSAALVRLIRAWAERREILDHPNERSSHVTPTPRGGGIAIVLVTLIGSAYWMTPKFAVAAVFALIVAWIGFIDDLRGLPARFRLLVQVAAATPVALLFVPLPWALLAIVWIVGLTNAYNFMDGIDGIAGGQAVVAGLAWAALGMAARQPLIAVVGLLIAGSSAGFLLHNWQPARIFMGDAGATFLGFMFAALTVMAWPNWKAVAIGALALWPFVADASFTFARRALRRERVMEAHKSHIYQRLNQRGLSHAAVASIYIALAAAGAAAGIALAR
jgi:UDP-N-acetylmuramyl pentapeptide phosphotransferase/UDP-N-acetylglucosamine-1-phosphate transferase